MALRILQFSALFAVGSSFGDILNSGYITTTPEITLSLNLTDPQDVIVEKGQEAVLKCQAQSSKGKIKITWQHNNKAIPDTSTKWRILENGDLHIPKVFGKKSHGVTGEYRCLVRNQAGALLSSVAKLSIASMDKEFSKNPENLTVYESQPSILHCGIHSNPPADIQFEFNDTLLPQETRYVPLSNRALLIENSQTSDAGTYRCRARNNILDKVKYSKIAVIRVLPNLNEAVPPNFLPLDVKLNNTVDLGEKITLYCAVNGWPTPTVQWIKGDRIVSNSTLLEIEEAELHHSGTYTCLAFNKAGRISQQRRVEVRQKPFFTETPLSKYYPSAMIVRLRCRAVGVPEPVVTWLKDGHPLRYSARVKVDNITLILSHTFSTDSGIYQCIATNSVGSVWTAAQIEIVGSSNPPHSLTCRSLDSSRICLSWKPPRNGSALYYSGYSFYKVNGSEIAGPEYVTNLTYQEVSGLYSGTSYMFYVRSYLKRASDASENVTCTTGVVGNRNLDIEQNGEDSVNLKWSEISSDVTCTSVRYPYKVQWRMMDQDIIDYRNTENTSLVVTGLLPGTEYVFKVTSVNETENGLWVPYTTSYISPDSNDNESVPLRPEGIKISTISPCSVILRWAPFHKNVKYFTTCYSKVSQNFKCDDRTSYTNLFQLDHLTPNAAYQFKVRAHNFEGVPGPFSDPFIFHTPADVPSKIDNIRYTLINENTVGLHWQAPSNNGKELLYYHVCYTSDINVPIENWSNVTVPAVNKSVSTFLRNLTSGAHYHVMVRAVSEVGIGKINTLLEFSTVRIIQDSSISGEEVRYHKKLGLIIGTLIALLCVICCAFCIVMRRRCVKRWAMDRATTGDSFDYPAAAHYASQVGAVQVRLREPCTEVAPERGRLLADGRTARNPPASPYRVMDSKGSEQIHNGYANGCKKPLINGHLQITENPQLQFDRYGCKTPKSTGNSFISRLAHQPNANVKSSKLHDSPARYHRCDPHFGGDEGDSRGSCDDVHSSGGSSKESSFNTTQQTDLDESTKCSTDNGRRKALLVGPNG